MSFRLTRLGDGAPAGAATLTWTARDPMTWSVLATGAVPTDTGEGSFTIPWPETAGESLAIDVSADDGAGHTARSWPQWVWRTTGAHLVGIAGAGTLDEDSDGLADWYAVDVTFHATGPGQYGVGGSLSYTERNDQGFDEWRHVAWDDATPEGGVDAEGDHTVRLTFSGNELWSALDRLGGSAALDLHLNLWSDTGGDWWPTRTGTIARDDFEPPAARLSRVLADAGRDANDDGLYDTLNFTLEVIVGQDGYYEIGADLVKREREWEWNWITHTNVPQDSWQNPMHLAAGTHQIDVGFNGEAIRAKGYDAPYFAQFFLMRREAMESGEEDGGPDGGCPGPCEGGTGGEPTAPPAGAFSISGTILHESGAGSGDYVVAAIEAANDWMYQTVLASPGGFTIDGLPAGDYVVAAIRDGDADGEWSSGEPWGMHAHEAGPALVTVDEGSPAASGVDFALVDEGTPPWAGDGDCADCGTGGDGGCTECGGEPRVMLGHPEFLGRLEASTQNAYAHDQFQAPGAYIVVDDLAHGPEDAGGDALAEFFTIRVPVAATETADFVVHADLSIRTGHRWEWVGWAMNESRITQGTTQTLDLRIDGSRIRQLQLDGELIVQIRLSQKTSPWMWTELGSEQIEAGTYAWEQFAPPPGRFVNKPYAAQVPDSDGDGAYEAVVLPMDLELAPGTYEVTGELFTESPGWRFISWASTGRITVTEAETRAAALTFSGADIKRARVNGDYVVRASLHKISGDGDMGREQWSHLDEVRTLVGAHQAGTFEAPRGSLADELVSGPDFEGAEGSYAGMNITLGLDADPGRYDVFADLFVETEDGGRVWAGNAHRETVVSGAGPTVVLAFDGGQIKRANAQGDYVAIARLHRIDSGWSFLDEKQYAIAGVDPADFASVRGTFQSAAAAPQETAGAYDGVAVTMQLDLAPGTYIVNGGLHTQDWSAFLGDASTRRFTVAEEGVVEKTLVFDGGRIYESGASGTFVADVWLFKVQPNGHWSFLDARNGLSAGDLSFEDFAPPTGQFRFAPGQSAYAIALDPATAPHEQATISVDVTVGEGRDYQVAADLYVGGTLVDSRVLSVPESGTYTLAFPGSQIRAADASGAMTAVLALHEVRAATNEIFLLAEATASGPSVTPEDFAASAAVLGDLAGLAAQIDENGDLVVVIPLEGLDPGETYEVAAALNSTTARIAGASSGALPGAPAQATLVFDGSEIQAAGQAGPYLLEWIRLLVTDASTGAQLEVDQENAVALDGTDGMTADDFS